MLRSLEILMRGITPIKGEEASRDPKQGTVFIHQMRIEESFPVIFVGEDMGNRKKYTIAAAGRSGIEDEIDSDEAQFLNTPEDVAA